MALTNADIAELLARRGDETEGPRQRAYRRSAAAAFVWPEEAAAVHAQGRPLTELSYVGDRLAARIAGWVEDPPAVPEPPEPRRGFITLSDVLETLSSEPGIREQLKGDLQMHTVYSDGVATVEQMASAAETLGYEYIAITDHSTGQRVPKGMDGDAIERQTDEIEKLNGSLKQRGSRLRVLHSIEMNLYPDGGGALDGRPLGAFEVIVGSFHSQLRVPEDQTDRYLAALRNPAVDIIGHPRGRMYNRRGGLHANWDAVFDAAVELDKAFEINANPARQDLQIELLELARDKGVRLSIGTDSHSIPELDFVVFSLASAIKAGIRRDRILNFGSVDDIVDWRRGRP